MNSDSNENSAPASEAEQPKPNRKPGKKAMPATKTKPAKAPKPKADRANKKARAITSEVERATGLAGAHRPWLRQHPREEGREDRIVQEHRRRARVQDQAVVGRAQYPKRHARLGAFSAFGSILTVFARLGCRVGSLLFRILLLKRATAHTPERSSSRSGPDCCLLPSPRK